MLCEVAVAGRDVSQMHSIEAVMAHCSVTTTPWEVLQARSIRPEVIASSYPA